MTHQWPPHQTSTCAPWGGCTAKTISPPLTPPEGVCVGCRSPPLSRFIRRCVTPHTWTRTSYVWATPRPRRRGSLNIVFLGLDNSGKTSIIQSLLQPQPQPDKGGGYSETGSGLYGSPSSPLSSSIAGSLPAAPPPTAQVCKYALHVGSTDFVAVDLPGALSKRRVWSEALRHCDGVVFVVDSADSLRFRVVRAEMHRIMPAVQKKALPCLVLATKQDLFTAKSKEEVLLSTSLSQLCSHLPAPWALKPCSVQDGADLTQALCWLLAHAKEMRSLVGEAAREKHVEYQARNLGYNLSKLQEMQEASYIKTNTWG